MDEFWVFGYGSLMWNPGFDYVEKTEAHLFGFRRSLCIRSSVHRGTTAEPGLVLGLDRGGSCRGMAFRTKPEAVQPTLHYLRDRELVTNVYLERTLPVTLADGRRVKAITYIADRTHPQYAGALDVAEAAAIVLRAHGQSGPNDAYVRNTIAHLHAISIRDAWLEQVVSELDRYGVPA